MAFWETDGRAPKTLDDWRESLRLACRWSIDRAMIRTADGGFDSVEYPHVARYRDWRGAFRGEYSAATRRWDVYAPVWHGGQGVKGLALAFRALGDADLLEAARLAADFILRHQIDDPSDEDCGLILAYENAHINTSAILESLDGLFTLGEVTGESAYADAAVRALRWVARKAFMPDQGRFREEYDPDARTFIAPYINPATGRPKDGAPMLDDGVFVKGYRHTGDPALLDVARRVADRLLAMEDPPGNWVTIPPSNPVTRVIHPRSAYWYGRPMVMVAEATGDDRYLACARRCAAWYRDAMRLDGGIFRDTGPAFNTPSFGHATSGAACAALLWHDLAVAHDDTEWDEPAARALRFCYSLQFADARDENLRGAVLEKVIAPCGSDAPPWYLRDIGTFFCMQAVSRMLLDRPPVLEIAPMELKAQGA